MNNEIIRAGEPFYMVHVEAEPCPTYRHRDYESARTEAIRLMKVSGKEATILQAVSAFAPPKEWVEKRYTETPDDLPF